MRKLILDSTPYSTFVWLLFTKQEASRWKRKRITNSTLRSETTGKGLWYLTSKAKKLILFPTKCYTQFMMPVVNRLSLTAMQLLYYFRKKCSNMKHCRWLGDVSNTHKRRENEQNKGVDQFLLKFN